MTPIYFDHNATTPVDETVLDAMLPYFSARFGNPSSLNHSHGHIAAQAVEAAREQVAIAIGAVSEEVIFTGSCTEANNIAILGVALRGSDRKHFVTSVIEHPSVLEVFRHLEQLGHEVTYVGVDRFGSIAPELIEEAITSETALVSVMGANNEIGTVQDISKIGAVCEKAGVVFHSDLAQVTAYNSPEVQNTNLHLASLSAHKAYGPKGAGVLYVRSRRPRVRLATTVFGGGQERNLRSGTLNVPAIVGMGAAVALARKSRESETKKLTDLRAHLLSILRGGIGDIIVNGHPTLRLPNNLSLSIPGVDPHALIRALKDIVSFSASSACAASSVETSHVLLAVYGDDWRSRNAFRLGLGRSTTIDQVEIVGNAIVNEAIRMRNRFGAAIGAEC